MNSSSYIPSSFVMMGWQFDSCWYTNAFMRDHSEYDSEHKIARFAREALQFTRLDVSFERFNEEWDKYPELGGGYPNNIIERIERIAACVLFAFSSVIVAIVAIAVAVFQGIPIACRGNPDWAKAHLYWGIRSLEGAVGKICSIFAPRIGEFLNQRGYVHQCCYRRYIEKYQPSLMFGDGGETVPNFGSKDHPKYVFLRLQHGKIDVQEYLHLSPSYQDHVCKELKSMQILYKGETRNVLELVAELERKNPAQLNGVTLLDFMLPMSWSMLQYAFLDDEEFMALTLGALQENVHMERWQAGYIVARLRGLKAKVEYTLVPVRLDGSKQIEDMTLIELTCILPEEIERRCKDIPALAFTIFSVEQLETIKLSQMRKTQIRAMFYYFNSFVDRVGVNELEDASIVKDISWQDDMDMYPRDGFYDSSSSDWNRKRDKFSQDKEDLQKAFVEGLLSIRVIDFFNRRYEGRLLGLGQANLFDWSAFDFNNIDLAKYDPYQISQIYGKATDGAAKFALLQPEAVWKAYLGGRFQGWSLERFITDEQLKCFNPRLMKDWHVYAIIEKRGRMDLFDEEVQEYIVRVSAKAREEDDKMRETRNDSYVPPDEAVLQGYRDLLGVPGDADKAAIKKAYKKASMKAHPDKNLETDTKNDMQELVEARDALLAELEHITK